MRPGHPVKCHYLVLTNRYITTDYNQDGVGKKRNKWKAHPQHFNPSRGDIDNVATYAIKATVTRDVIDLEEVTCTIKEAVTRSRDSRRHQLEETTNEIKEASNVSTKISPHGTTGKLPASVPLVGAR